MGNKVFYPLLALLLVLPFALIAYFWNVIPDTIPIHYNIRMEPDNWAPKVPGIFLVPGIMVGLTVFLSLIPYIDPKRNSGKNRLLYNGIVLITISFLSGIYSLEVLKHSGYDVGSNYVSLGILLLFMLLGNLMINLKPNYFFGVRTPWTLESDEVWRVTHRFAGYLWVAASAAMVPLMLFLPNDLRFPLLIAYTILIAALPIGYSFWKYRQLKKPSH